VNDLKILHLPTVNIISYDNDIRDGISPITPADLIACVGVAIEEGGRHVVWRCLSLKQTCGATFYRRQFPCLPSKWDQL
jgi:hypothetical protein